VLDSFRRLRAGLERVRAVVRGDTNISPYAHHLTRVLFHPELANAAYSGPPASTPPLQLFNPSLNQSQIDAIGFALHAPDVALIHGPVRPPTTSCCSKSCSDDADARE